ncbi:MAG: biotin--[acetyl-CoA-carboxylase] ligase [Actinomycetota bacterium]|nr:biotin--[acetyl-CoA-carboxylase] ligase [Actinomycetota bacterium]MDQ3574386.1 biotin--[acetyl-CoA-carboxylase] ligase [Actinomycetota bacterium]
MRVYGWSIDWDVRRLAEVDSTNRYLLDEARAGAPEGVVVVAEHQTAGRGRLGRRWWAPEGSSLLMSVLLRPTLPPERLHLAAAALALAASDACQAETGVRPGLKWPNDLVVEDLAGDALPWHERKLGGVLAEVDLPAVVVGLGLNMNWALGERAAEPPAHVLDRAVALDHLAGRSIDGHALLDRLLASLGHLVLHWGEVASQYRRHCVTVGRPVRVELVGETIAGTAEDIDADGRLVVSTNRGPRTVSTADVVHLRPGR